MLKKEMKVTVVGGSGFIGTHFCRRLTLLKIPFEIIDIKNSKTFPEKCKFGDVRDIETLRSTVSGNVILNLAAIHRDDVKDSTLYHETNVKGAENIAAVCTEKGIKKIIFTSSVAVYGLAKAGTGEDGKIDPFNEYGKTKFQAEETLRAWHANSSNSLIIVRPTVVFGEGNRGNVYNLLQQIASGKFIMVGSGKNKKSMAYIENLVMFLAATLEANNNYALFNYVDTPDLDMNELVRTVRKKILGKDNVGPRLPLWLGLSFGRMVDIIGKVTSRTFPISYLRVVKFCSKSSFSSSKETLNGFEPKYSLKDAIDRTLMSEFIDVNPDREIFYTE
jgi:GlcNAc-P-P-Und epimerase